MHFFTVIIPRSLEYIPGVIPLCSNFAYISLECWLYSCLPSKLRSECRNKSLHRMSYNEEFKVCFQSLSILIFWVCAQLSDSAWTHVVWRLLGDTNLGAVPEFPVGGDTNPPNWVPKYDFATLKLRKIWVVWWEGGQGRSLRSATARSETEITPCILLADR